MATLAQILDEMANSIRTAVDGNGVDVQVEPRMVLNPTGPCIDVWPADPSDDPEIRGMDDDLGAELITVRVRIHTADHDASQDVLLGFMDDEDPLSISAALNDDTTLNGYATSLDIRSRSGYQLFPVDEGAMLGCLFTVVVIKAQS